MSEFIPWFIQHYWLAAVVLFVVLEILAYATIGFVAFRIWRRRR